MIGLAIYHATDLTERPGALDNLLAAAEVVAGKDVLSYMQGQFASSDRFSKQQRTKAAALNQLKTDLLGNVYRSVQLDELPRSQQDASTGYTSLHLDLTPARSPIATSRQTASYPYRAYMLVPRDSVANPAQLQKGLSFLTLALDAPYAFAYFGNDFRDALMEVVSIPMFPWGYELSPADVQRQARLSRCQTERLRIGHMTCGAHWANILGKDMVERLGGMERAKREAPVALAHQLSGDRLYLQLTSDLPDPAAPEFQRLLTRLEEYLAPVSVHKRNHHA